MVKFLKICGVALVSTALLTGGLIGCTPKPSNEDIGKLDEAKAAAESAERKLSELRNERMTLEKELDGTTATQDGEQQELDELKEEGETSE